MVQLAYKLHQVTHNTTTIKGITNETLTPGIEQYVMQGGGSLDPFNIVTEKADQKASFITEDLKVALDLSFLTPLAITSGALGKMYFRKLADGGVYAGANDILVTINKGMMYLKSISAKQFGHAAAQYEILPTFDGTNVPLLVTNASTAPTLERDTVLWGLGNLIINSTDIPNNSMDFDAGINVKPEGSKGYLFNTECFTISRNPMFTFQNFDLSRLIAAGISPLVGATSTGNVVVTLRKFTIGGGTHVADATEEHIKFTMTGAAITPTEIVGNSGALATIGLVIKPVYDGSNSLIAIDTTAAAT